MSTELTTLPDLSGAQGASMEVFDEMVRSAFLPRISLMAGTSGLVQEGKMGVGKYAFIRAKDEFVDLGDTWNCYPISWRFCALRFGSGDESTKAYYDPNSEEFKQIKIDAQEDDSGCAYGPQFLLWVPTMKEFASYLFGSKSARPVARNLNALMKPSARAATFKMKLASGGGRKWPVPVILQYNGPAFDMPNIELAQETAAKFNNPPKIEEEELVQSGSAATGGERAR